MGKRDGYYIELDEIAENMLRGANFLGCGHNGIVYLLEDNKVIKIFRNKYVCKNEYDILKKTSKSKYFPEVYFHGDYYIVRSYISGERLDYYIKQNGLNKEIAVNIIQLIKEFKKLGFTKLDIRCKDLYLDDDFSIKVIDPKNNYSKNCDYPRHLMKGLSKLGVLDNFLEIVKKEYSEDYGKWNFKIRRYLRRGIK
ncbi:serine/threonine protein kinase [Clostridium sp. MT-14]|jgi:RIO-like serine/threonine protein kinase|uniref:Serine/threonine protein kinase n=1 Tax=Clostridium aromativorans TaxID=2836848 RepID=A0ABS8N8W0_9CLOT|nr:MULTISPECIES: serine/threonine protein kinase [Clostridium]KAA8676334.1 serine/threonine protein kinase [Clostridium sp. HV4-5-A1G]MCC9296250.1 serine/threonine protein kinase [Clostridium aromativorans]